MTDTVSGAALRRKLIEERDRRAEIRERCENSLVEFIAYMWHAVEPEREFVRGWVIDAIAEHLMAVTKGHIKRLAIGVPPGFMKSLSSSVFWPAFEWGPRNLPSMRYLCAAYSQGLTNRDNAKFLTVIRSEAYQRLWGNRFSITRDTVTKPENNKSGFKLASGVSGVSTGERADRVVIDDANSIKSVESDIVRNETNRWFVEIIPTRINDPEDSAIVVIQQRTHESDVTGVLLSKDMGYTYLCVPMEYDSSRHCVTVLERDKNGEQTKTWEDPRTEEGELAFPERFTAKVVSQLKADIGEYGSAAQMQQLPAPRGGGIIKRAWWMLYPPLDHPERDTKGRIDFPPFDYVVGSLDSAYTEKQENDPSAITVFGIWRDGAGVKTLRPRLMVDGNQLVRVDDDERSKIMLIYAWKKRVELHGALVDEDAQVAKDYCLRCQAVTGTKHADNCKFWLEERKKTWGLVEWTIHIARSFKINHLLIEAKASGLDVSNALRTFYSNENFSIEMVDPKGDKVARAHAIAHLLSGGLVYAPQIWVEREQRWAYPVWAQMCLDDTSVFPRGGRDITDTVTQALRHLRMIGLAKRNDEVDDEREEAMRIPPRQRALYPS